MKKLLFIPILSLTSATLLADSANLQFDGSIDTSCTVVATQTGDLDLNGQVVSTTNPAQATIAQNSPGSFNVSITPPTSFSVKPNGFNGDLLGNATASYSLSGNNNGVNLSGVTTLNNSGSDSISLLLSGATSETLMPGEYQLMAVVSCDAML